MDFRRETILFEKRTVSRTLPKKNFNSQNLWLQRSSNFCENIIVRKPFSFGKEKSFRTFRKETFIHNIDCRKKSYICVKMYIFIDIFAIK